MSNGGIHRVAFIDQVHPYLREQLEKRNIKCDDLTGASREEILDHIPIYNGIVIRSRFPVDMELLQKAKNLKFIARSGSGMENIDCEFARLLGISLINSPEGNRTAVAEHAIGMLLALFNNLRRADTQVRKGIWDREGNRGLELEGKVFAIIGYGNTGSALAERLKCFGVRILAYDKYKENYAPDWVEESDWEKIYEEADIVSLHVPLAEDTINLMNKDRFAKFRKPVYLVNTARGKNVNIGDLISAMKAGKVPGACLDVLEFESASFEKTRSDNPAFKMLLENPAVIVSPHVAGWTHESYRKLSYYLYRKIEAEFFS